jgi:type I restriction enzyme S subunit
MSLSRYPEYKDSGVPWLGDVPGHWEIIQSRRMFAQRKDRAEANDQQLTASQKLGIVYQADYIALEGQKVVQVITGSDLLKHVEPNDFVISMRSFQGGIEWSGLRGSISSAYVMLIPSFPVNPNFFRYLFKSGLYIQALQTTSNLVRDGQALRYENFTQVDLPLLPFEEQAAIASFLDRETRKIDALINEQQRLVKLLAEKRQSVISHVVTKGLNPNARMKDSGIEWLGEVPEHWEVKRLKHSLRLLTEKTDRRDNPIALENIEGWSGRFIPTETEFEGEGIAFERGDILFGKLRPYLAKIYLTESSGEAVGDFHVMRPMRGMDGRFAVYQMLSRDFITIVNSSTFGAKMPRVNWDFMSNMSLVIPPRDEQQAIASFLDTETANFDTLTAEANRAIELLKERRSALISAAVTGKIDVRHVGMNPDLQTQEA